MEDITVDRLVNKIKLEPLTDDGIIKFAPGEVENAEDYNLKFKHYPPYRKGLFDDNIFGSLKVCKCGATSTPGLVCPMCGGRVLSKEEASTRMGHYKLTFPFVSQYKIKPLCDELEAFHPEFAKFSLNAKGTKVSGIKGLLKSLYGAKLVYTPINEEEITVEDLIVEDSHGYLKVTVEYYDPSMDDSSISNWGPMGLRNFVLNYTLSKYVQKSANFILKYVNQVFVLLPITKRPAIVRKDKNGKPGVSLHGINTYYRAVINIDQKMFDIMNGAKTLADKLTVVYSMNRMIDYMYNAYKITASSKESLIRNTLSGTIKRSGRANIVGATDIPVDTVKIPRAMAYECLKSEVVAALKEKGVRDPIAAYMNPSSETMKLFEDLVKDYCVIMLRNPTLSKTNLSAFKVVLWDEIAAAINILACPLFNADFDGDQMAFFWVTDPRLVKMALDKMGAKRNWRLLKDNSFIFKFQIASLQGLYIATQVRQHDPNKIKYFTSLQEIERAYENNEIDVDEVVDLFGKKTTYGREKVSDIIKVDLDDLIGKNVPISAKNASKILGVFELQEDGIERHHKLMLFGGHIGTFSGNTTVSLEDIFQTEPITPEIKKIIDSNEPDSIKYRKLNEIVPDEMMKEVQSLDSKNIIDIIQGAGKIKKSNLPSLFGPRIEYSKENGLVVYDNSIAKGFNEASFISHVKENREILIVKKFGTPAGGYLARQMINVCNNFTYTTEPSTSTKGIVSKAKYVQGRIKIDGSKVTESGDVIIRVKSCIDNGTDRISEEELSNKEVFQFYEPHDSVGSDVSLGVSEGVVQGLLGLKHGGALKSPSKVVLRSLTPGFVSEIKENYIIVQNNGVQYKYIKPKSVLLSEFTDGKEFKENSILLYEDKEIHVEAKLESLSVFLDSFTRAEHVKKSEIKRTFCYAPCDGKIFYNIENESSPIVKIGSIELPFADDEIYYFPEGYNVKKGDRICGGVVNIDDYKPLMNNDSGWLFYIFKAQAEHILGNDDIQSELWEVVFKGVNTEKKFSVAQAARKTKNLINKMNLGYTREAIRESVGQDIGESFLTDLVLGDIAEDDFGIIDFEE